MDGADNRKKSAKKAESHASLGLSRGISRKNLLDLLCPVLSGTAPRYRHLSSTGQRFNFYEYFLSCLY